MAQAKKTVALFNWFYKLLFPDAALILGSHVANLF